MRARDIFRFLRIRMVPVELSACDEHENFKIGAEQENY
jgi:hypothetical protein